MRILLTIPALSPPHGGLRVIMEWANHLVKNHQVTLGVLHGARTCSWFKLAPRVRTIRGFTAPYDCLIITSPHTIDQQHRSHSGKVFIFMQMLEHLFRPLDRRWNQQCVRFYTSPHPLIAISQWNIRMLRNAYKRTGPVFYIGNGVNMEHFPLSEREKDGRTVLVEGWVCGNPAKDVNRVGPQVAERLKADGYRIVAFSKDPISDYQHVVDAYHCAPSLPTMNELYEQATILLKASRFDARACAPMEAMTKGTVTARALIEGDDDLCHEQNCLRTNYMVEALYREASRLLSDNPLRERLAENCRQYVQRYSWEFYMEQVERILTGQAEPSSDTSP